jgi:hypothetical protein
MLTKQEDSNTEFVVSPSAPSRAPDTARTCNLQFRRLSLYPIELRVLSVAEVDHMAQPGFGKAKMQGDQASVSVSASASSDGVPLCVEGRFGAFLLTSEECKAGTLRLLCA